MSEPIFEASVRLRADTQTFESEATAKLDAFVKQAEQKIAQTRQQTTAQPAQTQATQAAAAPAPEVAPSAPVQVPVELVPPFEQALQEWLAKGTPPTVQVPVETKGEVTVPQDAPPVKVPVEYEQTAAPEIDIPPAHVPVTVDKPVVPEPTLPTVPTLEVPVQPVGLEELQSKLAAVEARIAEQRQIAAQARASGDVTGETAATDSVREAIGEVEELKRQIASVGEQKIDIATNVEKPVVPPVEAPDIEVGTTVDPPVVPDIQPKPVEVPLRVVAEGGGGNQVLDAAIAKAQTTRTELTRLQAQLSVVSKDLNTQLELRRSSANAEVFARSAAAEKIPLLEQEVRELTRAVILQRELNAEAQKGVRVAIERSQLSPDALLEEQLRAQARTAEERARSAGLSGDPAGEGAQRLQAAILERQALALAEDQAARSFLAQAELVGGAQRDVLIAQAEASVAAAERLRLEAAKLQREGVRIAQPPSTRPTGEGGGLLDTFRSIAGQRSGGLAGLAGGALRFGLAGFAFTAAFQAFGELQQTLRATGDEAFTTQGKIRNLGAELLTGNFIGGIKQLFAAKPATLVGGLSEALEQFRQLQDETVISLEEVIALQRQGAVTSGEVFEARAGQRYKEEVEGASDALEEFLTKQVETGAISSDTAKKIGEAAAQLEQTDKFAKIAAASLSDFERAVASAGSAAAKFGSEGGLEGRGVGQIGDLRAGQGPPGQVVGQQQTGVPRPIITNPFENPVFQEGSGGEEVARQIRESIAQRAKSEAERLEAELASARITRKQAQAAFDAAKEAVKGGAAAGSAADEYAKLVTATTALGQAAAAVADQAAQAAAEIQRADQRIRDAEIAAIRDPEQRERAALGAAAADERTAKAELDRLRKQNATAAEIKEAEAAYKEAQSERIQIQNSIADQAEAAAEAAAASRANAVAQGFENQIAKAALTKRKTDDKAAFDAAIDYWRSLTRAATSAEEREQARAKVIELRRRRQEALTGQAASGSGEDLELLRIQNRIAAAGLTDRIDDDKKFTRQLIAYWKEKVEALRGEAIEQEKARSQLIAAQRALKNLQQQSGDSAEVFARKLMELAADTFRQFGSNISASPNGLLSPQDAIGQFSSNLVGGGRFGFGDPVQREQLTEQQKQTSILQGIEANTGRVGSTGRKAPLAPEESRVSTDIGVAVIRGM